MRMMTDIRFKLHFRPALLMMAAVAVLLLPVSCKDHDVYVENVIGMSAFHAGTRALVTNINDMGSQSVSSGHGFGVYGYKTKSGNNTQIFTNQEVTATESGTNSYTWSYIPLKYWDMSAEYHYVAYWPYRNTGSGASHDNDTHILTLSGIPNWQPSASGDDWLIATSSGPATSYFHRDNYTDGMVYFTFSHLLAQLEVQVALAESSATNYYITGLSIGNDPDFTTHTDVPDGTGTFSYNINYASSTTGNYVTQGWGYATLYPVNSGQTLKLTTDFLSLCSSLCVPFNVSDENVSDEGIYLNLTYNTGANTPNIKKSVVIPLSNGVNLTELEKGKKYVVRLRFDMGETLKVVKVYINDWETATDPFNHQFYNW